jgi:hypothetical protein
MKRIRPVIVGLVLLVIFVAECFGAQSDSQTIDEGAHLASGLSYLSTGKVTLNPEHPPLIKLLAAAPVFARGIQLPFSDRSWKNQDQWEFARRTLYHATIPPKTLLLLGRIPIIILTLALALAVERTATRFFGSRAGLFTLGFFILDPTVLAHGRLITTDVGVSLFFFLTVLAFSKVILRPTWSTFLPFALCFSAAQLSKFSAAILWIVLPMIGLLALIHPIVRQSQPLLTLRRWFAGIGLLIVVSGLSTWALYGFRADPALSLPAVKDFYADEAVSHQIETDNPILGIPFFRERLSTDHQPGKTLYRLAEVVPIPALPYFQGLIDLALHNIYGHGTFLFGETSTMGWWYYFPAAFFLKTPAIVIVLGLLSLVLFFLDRRKRTPYSRRSLRARFHAWWDNASFLPLVFALPPLLYLAWSMTSHINLGVRHLLPVLPFFYCSLGYLFSHPIFSKRLGIAILSAFFVGTASIAILTYPNELSYFSEFVGGSRQGPRYLLDSNFDWSQGFNALKEYVDQRKPERLYGVFFTSIDLQALGINFERLPTTADVQRDGLPKGTVAISGGVLFDPNSFADFGWLRSYQPTTRLRESIYIFDF